MTRPSSDEAIEFYQAIPLEALRAGMVTSVQVNGRYLALYVVDGQPFCTEDACTHEGSAISAGGYVDGDEVECPWHGARFNIKTGAVTSPPAFDDLRTFPVAIIGNSVHVGLPRERD